MLAWYSLGNHYLRDGTENQFASSNAVNHIRQPYELNVKGIVEVAYSSVINQDALPKMMLSHISPEPRSVRVHLKIYSKQGLSSG